jgi:putative endonuclease
LTSDVSRWGLGRDDGLERFGVRSKGAFEAIDFPGERSPMGRSNVPTGMRPVPGTLFKQFAVYILTNRPHGVLYVGMTSSLAQRVYQHREGLIPGFTKRYHLTRLVYYEHLDTAEQTIAREKRLKRWHRQWKIALIEQMNPTWRDLWDDIALA